MIYLADGTRDGFLTAFLAAWGDEEALLLPEDERPLRAVRGSDTPDPQKARIRRSAASKSSTADACASSTGCSDAATRGIL